MAVEHRLLVDRRRRNLAYSPIDHPNNGVTLLIALLIAEVGIVSELGRSQPTMVPCQQAIPAQYSRFDKAIDESRYCRGAPTKCLFHPVQAGREN